MRRYLRFIPGIWLAAGLLAQAPFTIRSTQGTNTQLLADGGTITFSSEGIGQSSSASVALTYTNRLGVTLSSLDVTGSTDFTTSFGATLPVVMNFNDTTTFVIQYTPTALGKVTGTVRIGFTETGKGTTNLNINLIGVQPDFGFSFLPPKGNQSAILPDATIAFPDTTVNLSNPAQSQTSSVTFTVTNRGSGPGTINNVASSSAPFSLSGVPLLPAIVQPNTDFKFTITFSPTQLASSSGRFRIDFVGRTVAFALTGSGVSATFAYEFILGANTRPISANDTLVLPQTSIGEKSTATVRVRNTGNADGTIARIASTGAEFPLTDVPFVPLTLAAGNAITFTITFAPTQPGAVTGRLRVDDVFFNLSGTGTGVTLTFGVTIGTANTTIANSGSLIFPPTQVTASSSARFQINNTGNAPTFVNSISVTGPAGPVFSLADLPVLPVRLGGGETVSFSVLFAPNTLGTVTGTLRVDTQTFNLSGPGTDPPPLPGVTFTGPGSAVDAAQQISVGLRLANPYPVQLDGKLLLTFAPGADVFSDDPAIQFASGGRSVNFVVPANSTQAVFGLNQNEVRLQTGTVAGTITLAALFATDPGGINLTASAAPAANITVRSSPPRLRAVQLANRTATAFTVLITGFAPSRSVTKMDFQFTPFVDPNNKDLKLDTTSLSLSVDGTFNSWYQSTASQAFGSLFTATVTFNVRGDIDAIQSLAVTIGNSLGNSSSMSVNLR